MHTKAELDALVRFIGPPKAAQLAQLVRFPTPFRVMHARRELRRAMEGFHDLSFWSQHLNDALRDLASRFPSE